MSNITIKFNITDNRIPELVRQLPVETDAMVRKVANDVVSDMVNSFGEPKTGILYRRGKGRKRIHQASADGEPPAVDFGTLSNSIKIESVKTGTARVNIGAAHGVHLEFGTRKMAARPFVMPAVERAWPVFRKAVEELVKRLIR